MLRHSTAHVLAEAARHVFPGVKVTIGPPIDNGFYYDFQFAEPITEADLETHRGGDAAHPQDASTRSRAPR